jgi:endonuclease/exonuclease/phosphatase family metal-dependent hydrolase
MPRQFGNAIVTRLPIRQVFANALPWPADPSVPSMPRVALEVMLAERDCVFRVICTHLEYYSATQRVAQADALRQWHEEACQHARHPSLGEPGPGPFTPEPRPASAILCGDFNSKPEDPAYQHLLAPFPGGAVSWHDAWQQMHPGQRHAPTCAIHDRNQWHEPPFACDFIFVTEDWADKIARCEVDDATQASDHQPLHLSLTL